MIDYRIQVINFRSLRLRTARARLIDNPGVVAVEERVLRLVVVEGRVVRLLAVEARAVGAAVTNA